MSKNAAVSSRALTGVIFLVSLGWLASVLADIFVRDFQMDPTLGSLMTGVIGFLFASRQAAVRIEEQAERDDEDAAGGKP